MLAELEEVCRTVGLVLGRRQVTADQRLMEDLGAESADILNIMVTLEQKYGVKIDEQICQPGVRIPDPDWSRMDPAHAE